MHTVHYIVGEIAKAPTLPPGCHWRRKVSPTVEPWRAEPINPDEPDEINYGRTGWSTLRWESKTVLDDGDEFECRCTTGQNVRAIVGAIMKPNANLN